MTARIGRYDPAPACSKKDKGITPVEKNQKKSATLQDRNEHVMGKK